MLHYTTLIALHYATLHYTTPHHTTLHSFTLHYTTLPHIALHCSTLHSLHHHKCNCNYTTLITPHHKYNSTTLQLQLQLRYTTLHPAVVGEVTDQVTTAAIAATPKNTAPTTFSVHQWLRSAIRNFTTTNLSYRFPMFETSATALCGTTGNFEQRRLMRMILYDIYWFPSEVGLTNKEIHHIWSWANPSWWAPFVWTPV